MDKYEPPIDIIYDISYNPIKEMENGIMQELEYKYGIEVNKEELVKALKYDRDQYFKGYEDGKREVEKALDKACEHLYSKGYKAPCHNSVCVVATTGYSEERKKEICSRCIKEYLLKEKDNETSNT